MGTWGVGVFSSDGALDVRDAFRELIGAGYSIVDATARVIESQGLSDQIESDAEWVALALTQWKTGRLLDWVRDRAVDVIDTGPREDWQPADVRRRQVVLAKARAQLLSPQRPPTRIARQRYAQTPFQPGDVVRFTCANGLEVAMWAIENTTHEGLTTTSVNTLFELLAFGTPALPPLRELLATPSIHIGVEPITQRPATIRFSLVRPQEATGPTWQVLANQPFPPERRPGSGQTVVITKRADATFTAWYERLAT